MAKKDTNKLEKKQATKDGAKVVANSGRGFRKGDARLEDFLIDYKFNNKSFSLTVENWSKFRQQAWKENHREPLIGVMFDDDTKVGIIDWYLLMELIKNEQLD